MARVSSFTIFVFISLIVYSTLGMAIAAYLDSSTYTFDPDPSAYEWLPEDVGSYVYTEIHNITKPSSIEYTTLDPDRKVRWDIGNYFGIDRKSTWGWWYYPMKWSYPNGTEVGTGLTETIVNSAYNSDKNYSLWYAKYIGWPSGGFETTIFFFPWCNTTGYIESWDNSLYVNDTISVYLCQNLSSADLFNIGKLFDLMTGYASYGAPLPVSVLLGGIWWMLLILTGAKLILG